MTQNDIYLFHFSLVQNLPFTCRSFSYEMPIFNHRLQLSVGGIVVSIAAFQAVDPGSIPGQRKLFTMKIATETLFHIINCSLV